MIEVWTNDLKGNDKLIGFGNGRIYKANPKTYEEAEELARKMRAGSFDETRVWDIRTNNCREIRLQEGKECIEIFWGKEGEEQLNITDEYLRYKIFDLIKANTPEAKSTVEKWNAFRAGKKPLIAFGIVLAIFLWTLSYAVDIEKGIEYEVAGGRNFSLAGIILGIASMGVAKVVTIFSVLLGIALLGFIRKVKKLPVMHRLLINK